MAKSDSTAIRFVKPAEHTVILLCCPMCGSAVVDKTQAFAFDDERADDESILSGAHFQCHECKARLTVRIEKHRVSLRWVNAQ